MKNSRRRYIPLSLIVPFFSTSFTIFHDRPTSPDQIIGRWHLCAMQYDGEEVRKEKDSTIYSFRTDSSFCVTSIAYNHDTACKSGTWIYNARENRMELTYDYSTAWWFVADFSKDTMILRDGYTNSWAEREMHFRRIK